MRRLRGLDACSVSDALDRLADPALGTVVSGVPQASGEGCITGLVTTMKLGVGTPPPGPPRHLGATAIEASGPDHVILIEQRSGNEAGSWGGLLTLGAEARGVAGAVIDGVNRDVSLCLELNYPVFSKENWMRTGAGEEIQAAEGEIRAACRTGIRLDEARKQFKHHQLQTRAPLD